MSLKRDTRRNKVMYRLVDENMASKSILKPSPVFPLETAVQYLLSICGGYRTLLLQIRTN